MIKKIFILVISMATFGISNTIESSWAGNDIIINGNNGEWLENEQMVSPGTFVSVANNNDYVFVSLRTNNEQLAHKLSLLGLTLWISPDGKKKKENGLIYPIKQKNPREIIKSIKNDKTGKPTSCDIIEFVGNRAGIHYDNDNVKFMPLNFLNKQYLKVAVGCENSSFTYELKIPIKNYDKEILPFKIDKNTKDIRICFKSGALNTDGMQKQSIGSNHGINMSSKGGGRSGGGGKGGGRRAGAGMKGVSAGSRKSVNNSNSTGNIKTQMMSPFSIWLKVVLAEDS